jgi:hypothetical protein
MRKSVRTLLFGLLLAGLVAPSFAGPGVKFHFGVTGTFLVGVDFNGDFGALIGPGGRVDIDLGRILTVSPEVTWAPHWHTVAPALTLNVRLGGIYFGAGPVVTETDRSWDGDVCSKAHLGMRAGFWLIEAVCLAGRSSIGAEDKHVSFVGVTAGFMF